MAFLKVLVPTKRRLAALIAAYNQRRKGPIILIFVAVYINSGKVKGPCPEGIHLSCLEIGRFMKPSVHYCAP